MLDAGLKSGIKDELLKFKKKRYAVHPSEKLTNDMNNFDSRPND